MSVQRPICHLEHAAPAQATKDMALTAHGGATIASQGIMERVEEEWTISELTLNIVEQASSNPSLFNARIRGFFPRSLTVTSSA